MVSAQVSTLVAPVLIGAAAVCLVRLAILNLLSVYPAFAFFLVSQIATTALSNVANVRTENYAWTFLFLISLEWLSYGLMIRELYKGIFSGFPGIAVLGQWSLYGALLATIVIFIFGITPVKLKIAELGTRIPGVEFASHCVLFGFAAFILLLLVAVSRYPLGLHKNNLVNCGLFSIVLLGEIAELIANQATSRHFTGMLNFATSALGSLCFCAWGMLLSREGQVRIVKVGPFYSPADEARLLNQLSTVNTLLLRTIKK